MARARMLSVLLITATLGVAGGVVLAGEPMADLVARADDVSLKLSIENIDGTVVNVPEAHVRRIPTGDHYLGIKIEFRSVSGGSLITGLGVISAISGAVSNREAAHQGVSFTAEPGRRYLVNGALENDKPTIWVEEVVERDTRVDDLR